MTSKLGFSVCGADKDDGAVFDIGQQEILLSLVEAVDLVQEEDNAIGRLVSVGRGEKRHLGLGAVAR